MPIGLNYLRDIGQDQDKRISVDIVAVHGVGGDSEQTWTDPGTGINWLRELLPEFVPDARILTYGYDASASEFFDKDSPKNVWSLADTLVATLGSDRRLAKIVQRPIIFICHGLGGVLVKRSLFYSSTRKSLGHEQLYDQYITTYAILFFGTPHRATLNSRWIPANNNAETAISCIESISKAFSPLLKRYSMYCFWEGEPTPFGDASECIVDRSSAVIDLDKIEKTGIFTTHEKMVKFNSKNSSEFRTVAAALKMYCENAPKIVEDRWKRSRLTLHQEWSEEAYELSGHSGIEIKTGQASRPAEPVLQSTINAPFNPPQTREGAHVFIGRDACFQALDNAFFPGGCINTSSELKSFVVYGMGGVGKTQLCAQFAKLHCTRYCGGVFTIQAGSPDLIKESLSDIGETYGKLARTESAGVYYLSKLMKPWLLIIDNADDPTQDLRALLSRFPREAVAHILITTRNQWFSDIGSLGSLKLAGLTKEEAVQLLLMKANIKRPWDSSTQQIGLRVAQTFGCLALALVHAGSTIARKFCELGDYLDLHHSYRNSRQHRRSSLNPETKEEDELIKRVYGAFDMSLGYLLKEQRQTSQDALEILNIACFYHFEKIPIELFNRAMKNRKCSLGKTTHHTWTGRIASYFWKRFEPPKLLPRFLKDPVDELDNWRIRKAASELESLSLVTFDRHTISLHPLVHAWAMDRLGPERHVWASVALNTAMESIVLPPEGDPEKDGEFHRDILPHLEVCIIEHEVLMSPAYKQHPTSKVALLLSTRMSVVTEQIQNEAKCGYVFASRGQFNSAAKHLGRVKEQLSQLLGPSNGKTQMAMLALAQIYWGLGRLDEAIELQRQVVTTRTTIHGLEHKETLSAMNELGRSYWLHGMYLEALDLQEITAKLTKTTLGPDDPQTLSALDNYGVTLVSWQRPSESEQIHRNVLATRQKILGVDNLKSLETEFNLAMALLDLHRFEEARAMMTRVHQQRQHQLGKEHPWTLWALCYLAKINIDTGSLNEAEKMLDWGIPAAKRSLSETHLGVLMGYGYLARVYARQGRLDEAMELSLKTIKGIEAERGIEHPDGVYGLRKLAQLHKLRNEHTEAIDTCELALERADMRISRKHPLGGRISELLNNLRGISSPDPEDGTRKVGQINMRLGIQHQVTW